MTTVGDVVSLVESLAPPLAAFEWDRVGLQVGDRSAPCGTVLVCLDCTQGAVARARELGSGLIVSHHPVIWEPLRAIGSGVVADLVRNEVALYAAHTNWDCARGGINDELASRLGLSGVRAFGPGRALAVHKLVVFVPVEAGSALIDALSSAGAGVIGAYSRCAFFHQGTGTFLGGAGSNPVVGKAGEVEEVAELRVEMVVPFGSEETVEEALRRVHPYEEPAFDWVPLRPSVAAALGRVGSLPQGVSAPVLGRSVAERLSTRVEVWDGGRPIERVAVIGGAGSGEWQSALGAGAHALVTGEVKQSDAVAGSAAGLTMVSAGHYATEQPGMEALARALVGAGVACELFVPEPGSWGRPSSHWP
ncbi:MAG: Nif3-like dinuclear metal center hexameric protein [Fimbriimonadaceae bacterium]|nr:Nif3-like dinuclear metal center hexameric protein [Fimbriimonadaceae bacterium]QYK59451.1 MAG: Nif3-like dinuclear metal center hexameric protein [Fimbriimonadaceae bacterium]